MVDQQNALTILVGVITFMLTLFFCKHLWKRRRMPPGPLPLPILGNCLLIWSGGLVQCLKKLAEKFGPVYTFYFGSRPTLVLTGYTTVKEALVELGDAFTNRPSLALLDRMFRNGGLTLANDETWSQLRLFSLTTLKDFGMGKKSLEEPLQEEAKHLVDHFTRLNEQPVDPSNTLMFASSNVIANLVFGSRKCYDDKRWKKILQNIRDSFQLISSIWGQLYTIFPGIMYYLPGPHNKIFSLLKPLEDALEEMVRSHQKTLDPACPRDFIDCFLLRMKQKKLDIKSCFFTLPNLKSTIYDMFLAGAETTAITISFGFLILARYPELQDKVHKEIDQVIGREKEPRADDRKHMQYTNAFIHELQRYGDVMPLGAPRCTTKHVNINGYSIPKGTEVIAMLTTVLRDPSQFEKPEEFYVNHFLDENNTFKKNNASMPLSAGKRACVAERLVIQELFIFFTVILQKFTVKPTVDLKDFNITPTESSFERIPPNHKIKFIARTQEN
ncbi:cytochrome P450 2G1-like [Ranitomeya variabilis]|uniref:cytochrome P450 2G1-like n=1 Tax=Ranitomeya variabilis TaxID=490064 RepID=UPI004057BFE6